MAALFPAAGSAEVQAIRTAVWRSRGIRAGKGPAGGRHARGNRQYLLVAGRIPGQQAGSRGSGQNPGAAGRIPGQQAVSRANRQYPGAIATRFGPAGYIM
ncbi:MAG: hypothetical protein HLUCCA01_03340 [Bacteroidetes bacterium HLUCCA01]|nr:MAG: hypothetical protein HLUCCA01_03340 [Bacteroidetes bacterium HLUCCA01]